jgi:hypothetical protein
MLTSTIMLLAAEVLIQPYNEAPSVRPAWDPQRLNWMKPLDWNCKMRSSDGREFVVEGHFDKPNAFSRGQGVPTRPVTITISKPLQFVGSGTALMGWSSDQAGKHVFEIKNPTAVYQVEMDYIEPDQRGYMKILSSTRQAFGGAPLWQLEGVGVCTAKVSKTKGGEQ